MAATYGELEHVVSPWVEQGDLGKAIAHCEGVLQSLPRSDYHAALGRSWLSMTDDAARWLAEVCATAEQSFPVRAIYCEMNRFEINTRQWHIEGLAYNVFGDTVNLSWLVGQKVVYPEPFVLPGMTDLKALFARDYSGHRVGPAEAAADVVIMLLTLRMQQLMHAAAKAARRAGWLPQDLPVLSAAHDTYMFHFSYGRDRTTSTIHEPQRPVQSNYRRNDGKSGVYCLDWGLDQFLNCLPWHVLDYSDKDGEPWQLDKPDRLAAHWQPPHVSLRSRKWPCDIIALFPHWAVNEKAKGVLLPLLQSTVEFLPLNCAELPNLWLLHVLRHIDLGPDAIHSGGDGRNMAAVERYSFRRKDLEGIHCFGIKQAPGSPSRKHGLCFTGTYVSEDFKYAVESNRFQGVVFDEVFSYAIE